MFKSCVLFVLIGAVPLVSSAGSTTSYTTFNAWKEAIQQAGYQLVPIAKTNADALFVNCDSTCVQSNWGKQDNYDNIPRDPRQWIQLLAGTPIYGFGTYLQLTDPEQAGLAFASGDPRTGQPVTLLTTLNGGTNYDGFYGFVTDQAVNDLYIGYPHGTPAPQTSSDDTFSMNSIVFAVVPSSVASTPEPASFAMLGLGLGALVMVAFRARLQAFFRRSLSR